MVTKLYVVRIAKITLKGNIFSFMNFQVLFKEIIEAKLPSGKFGFAIKGTCENNFVNSVIF